MKENLKSINVESEGLLPVLDAASVIINKKSPVLSLGNILFSKKGIYAINEFCFLFHEFINPNDIEFDFGVSTELFKIVKQQKDVEFLMSDSFLTIKSEEAQAKMTYTKEVDMGIIPEIPRGDFKELPLGFLDALKEVKVFSSNAENSISPEDFCFIIENDSVFCTNNKVVTCSEFEEELESMLIPVNSFPILSIISPVEYLTTKEMVFFKNKNTIVGVKQLEKTGKTNMIINMMGEYSKEIEDSKKQIPVSDFKKAIDEANIFTNKEQLHDGILFHKEEDVFVLSTKNAKGEIKKDLFLSKDNDSENVDDFILSYKFLKSVVEKTNFFVVEERFVVFFNDFSITMIAKISK